VATFNLFAIFRFQLQARTDGMQWLMQPPIVGYIFMVLINSNEMRSERETFHCYELDMIKLISQTL